MCAKPLSHAEDSITQLLASSRKINANNNAHTCKGKCTYLIFEAS
uniref:Uncharacterized protein n=1 Tax=Rhizophora mucronata TaxID=61149 RepID=A0A2P2QXF7_RHIMU